MLASKYRLTGNDNFERVKKDGKVFQMNFFGVSLVDRKDSQPSRFAFIVSKSISKLATQRNRIKRALGEAVNHEIKYVNKGFDVVFLAKTNILNQSTEVIMREVKNSLKDMGLVS